MRTVIALASVVARPAQSMTQILSSTSSVYAPNWASAYAQTDNETQALSDIWADGANRFVSS
jgi:hypothetical protein